MYKLIWKRKGIPETVWSCLPEEYLKDTLDEINEHAARWHDTLVIHVEKKVSYENS